MKLSFKNINKTSLFISLIVHLIAFKAHGIDTVAIVNEIKGTVFVSVNGQTTQLKIGNEVLLGSEIYTSAAGAVSLTDYYDHQFHLSNSSHIKLNGDTVQLRRGQVWMQSHRKSDSSTYFKLSSANGIAKYNYGEAIFSFDPMTAKSQLLVIQGKFDFLNINNHMDHTYVEDGLFSYIETEKNEGSPRKPTPVGFSSFKKITQLFHKVAPIGSTDHIINRTADATKKGSSKFAAQRGRKIIPSWKNKKMSKRSIASVPMKSGNIIYIHGKNQTDSGSKFLNNQLKKLGQSKAYKRKKKVLKRSGVTVRIFGADFKMKRVPASVKKPKVKRIKRIVKKKTIVKKVPVVKAAKLFKTAKTIKKKTISKRAPASVSHAVGKADAFEKGLKKAYKKQTRHSPEMNSLIHDLKNYDQDFKTSY